MNTRKILARLGLGGLLIAGIALGAASAALAGHQWDDFHLQMPSDENGAETGPADVTVYLNNTGNGLIAEAAMLTLLGGSVGEWVAVIPDTDWAGGDVAIGDTGDSGVASSGCCDDAFNTQFTLRMEATDADLTPGTSSAVNSYNGSYGSTGWLGIAIVEDSASYTGDPAKGPHVIYGEIYLNDYYVDAGLFADEGDIKYVFCQELGHTLGLDHVKRDDTTCMYTPRGLNFFGPTSSPNSHDGEMVNIIAHGTSAHGVVVDDGGGGGNKGGGGGGGGGGKGRPASAGPIVGDPWAAGNPTISAFWAEQFESRDELFDSADLVVSATVLSGSAFDRNVGPSGLALPVSQAMLQVNDTYKGLSAPVITLEQSRGPGFEIQDDPGYVRDDNYILYLRLIGTNTYRVINPDGRVRQ